MKKRLRSTRMLCETSGAVGWRVVVPAAMKGLGMFRSAMVAG